MSVGEVLGGTFDSTVSRLGGLFGMQPMASSAVVDESSEPPLVAPVSDSQLAQATQSVLPSADQPQSVPQQPRPIPTQPATIPPQMQVAQQQTTYEAPKKISEEARSLQTKAEDSAVAAAVAQNSAAVAQANALAQEANQRAITTEQQNQSDAAELAKVEQDKAARIAKLDEAMSAYKKFSDDRKDGKRDFWATKSGGEIAGFTIGRILGAFGAALARTPNYSEEILNKEIDQHVRREEAEERRLGKAVDLAQNGYAFFRQQGLDTRQAQLARKQSMLEASQARVAAILATNKVPEVQANGQALLAALDQTKAKNRIAMELDTQGKAVTQTVRMPVGNGVSVEDAKKLQEMAINDPSLKEYRAARSSADQFRALVDAKADGAAVMNFIATGMKQGSFTPTFVEMLKKRGYLDAAGEAIRSKFKGGYDPSLIKEMQGGLDSVLAVASRRADPAIRQLRTMGLPTALIIGGQSEQETAAAMGGVAK